MQQLNEGTLLQSGKYKIERVLGQGGFGITYVVKRNDGLKVAIKEFFMQGINDRLGDTVTISNSANRQSFFKQKDKFLKEARRIQSVNDEHIVKVYESFEENDTAYYAMQLVHGISLKEMLTDSLCPEEAAYDIMIQLLEALTTIHSQNIWHLDLKPENVLIDQKGDVTLIDFGASKHIDNSESLTTSSSLAMTPGFAAPEQLQGDMSKFGPWTDYYALGATLYNITTNNLPPSFDDIISEGNDAFHFADGLSDGFKHIVTWFMQPNRHNRPQSIEEIVDYLNENEEQTIQIQENKRLVLTINGHDAVDLGLSVLWSTMDIGATGEERYGECYLWGDPNGKKTRRVLNSTLIKWFTGGPSSNNIAGDIRYDTATNIWGSPWRMPTRKEFVELAQNCTWELIDNSHVKLTGPNGNYIMLDNRWHWTSESPMQSMLMFSWENSGDSIYYNLPSADLRHKNYVDFIFPIRPVAEK